MLSTMRSSWLLYSLLSLMVLSSALNIEEALHIDGIEAYLHHGMKRQASGTGTTSPSEDPTSTPTPTSPTSTPTSRSSPTPSDPTTDDTSTPTSSPTTTRPTSTPTTATSDRDTSTTTTPPPRSTPFTSTSVTQFTITTKTISNGQEVDVTSVSSSTSTFTGLSGPSEPTGPAQTQNGESSSGGLSESNKKIIGGVVGGVGGAILLGGIALVCWRIWGRKKRVTEDDADLMAGTGSALGDKPQNGASPFQSNLEQYHNPGGRPNAAANF